MSEENETMTQKESAIQRELYREQREDSDNKDNGGGYLNLNGDEEIIGQTKEQQEWAKKMERIKKAAKLAEKVSKIYGQQGMAEMFANVGDVAEHGGDIGDATGDVKKVGSNLAGSRASKIAAGKGMGKGKSAAMGGAVAGALQGGGIDEIAKSATSWYLLSIGFGGLLTLIFSVPSLLYLDFHFIMSKLKKDSIFGEMFLWQKIALGIANVIFLFIVIAVFSLIAMIFDPCLMVDLFGWNIFGLCGVVESII